MKTRGSVLIVDDEPGLRDLLARELGQDGFEVEAVENGAAAIERLKRRKFDLAITDLEGIDGVATLDALRAIDPDLEVIVATGHATVETAVASLKHGAYDYIQKPYDLADLKALLGRAMEKSHLEGVVALYEASRALLATLDPASLVPLILDLARQVLRSDHAGLVLGDPETSTATVHRSRGASDETTYRALAARATKLGPHHLTGEALERHQGVGSALAYPLLARGQHLGALVLLRNEPIPPFSQSELQRGIIFAGQLSLALDNARLHEELGQKVDELVRTREQLVHAEKVSLAGELVGAVAHELNNPLAAVQLNLRTLTDYSFRVEELWAAAKTAAAFLTTVPGKKAQDISRELLRDGDECERTVREILGIVDETLDGFRRIADLVAGFTRLGVADPRHRHGQAEVARVVQECVATVSPREAEVECDVPPGLKVEIASEDLRTALLNLLSFLRRPARDRSVKRRIRISARPDDGLTHLLIAGEGLKLSAEEMRRLFDPRIEVEAKTSRTMRLNISLALAYRLLQRSGGQLLAHKQGAGMAFEVVLPASERAAG